MVGAIGAMLVKQHLDPGLVKDAVAREAIRGAPRSQLVT
jgi:hypothetical protein